MTNNIDKALLDSLEESYKNGNISKEDYINTLKSIKEEIDDEDFINNLNEESNNAYRKRTMETDIEYYGFNDPSYLKGKSLDEIWSDFCYNNDDFPNTKNLSDKALFQSLISKYIPCMESIYDLDEEILDEKYSKEELDGFVNKTFNQRKIISIFKSKKYETPELVARTKCINCGNRKNVLLSNIINDPDKYGSCNCSKENINAIVKDIQDLYAGKKKLKNNTSGYTGVYAVHAKDSPKAPIKWRAYITLEGKRVYLGDFASKSKAIKARQAAALHGIKYYRGQKEKLVHQARDNSTLADKNRRREKLDVDKILGIDDKESTNESLIETVEIHDTLNPKIWNEDKSLKEEVKNKIKEIVNKFKEYLEDYDIDIKEDDVYILGSNANFNYNDDSDLDIHIIADESMDCSKEHLAIIYNLARRIFNDKYDITINGINVEIYVENKDKIDNVANGVYSLKDGWIKDPAKVEIPEIDNEAINKKVDELAKEGNELFEQKSISKINTFIDKMFDMRTDSLVEEGEFGEGNLVFKEIRRTGLLDKLREYRIKLESKDLSLEESSIDEAFAPWKADAWINRTRNENVARMSPQTAWDYAQYLATSGTNNFTRRSSLLATLRGKITEEQYNTLMDRLKAAVRQLEVRATTPQQVAKQPDNSLDDNGNVYRGFFSHKN